MSGPPPPPPPHGENPKTTSGGSNLPPGKYDIFIIPPHSSGSGFLYLPSLKPNVNSFAAGFASALVLVVLGHSMAPAFKTWWNGFHGMGSVGIMLLVVGVAIGSWALGRTQIDSSAGAAGGGGGGFGGNRGWGPNAGEGFNWAGGAGADAGGSPPPPPPPHSSPPPKSGPAPGATGGDKPNGSWQQRSHYEQPPQEEPQPQQAPPPPKPKPKAEPKTQAPPPKPQPKAQPPPPKPAPKAQPSPTKPASKAQPPPSKPEPKAQPPPPKPEPKSEPKPEPKREPSTWEKAREEVKRKEAERKAREAEEKRQAEIAEAERKRKEEEAEAERKAKEAEQKRKEEVARRLKELREKEARERAKRDQAAKEKADKEAEEKAKIEKEANDKAEKEAKEKEQREQERVEQLLREKLAKEKEVREARLREARERDLRERLEREKALREKLEKEAKEREANRQQAQAKEAEAEAQRKSTYAYSAKGEKFNPWPNGRPPSQPSSPATPSANPTSAKRPPPPTARTYSGTVDDDQYSYRPYDEPKHHSRRRSGETIFTESSYAPSQSTARTSPPPSMRGPYETKDPNKIVIKAVYGFMNQFAKTPASQLLSGQGTVTDGLILRITTEGLFIDDDVRGVPQREWDVKAWTLKLMEVWCSSKDFAAPTAAPQPKRSGILHRPPPTRVDRGVPKVLTGDEADKFCETMLRTCKNDCRLCPHGDFDESYEVGGQPGEWQQRGLHVLRANIRDQEGKRYMFVLGEEEGWKVALGLQRLRKGTQVRQLGVQAMPVHEARSCLETLGWA